MNETNTQSGEAVPQKLTHPGLRGRLVDTARALLRRTSDSASQAAGLPEGTPLDVTSRHIVDGVWQVGAQAAGLGSDATPSDIASRLRETAGIGQGVDVATDMMGAVRSAAEPARQAYLNSEAAAIGLSPGATQQEVAQALSAVDLGLPPDATMEELIDERLRQKWIRENGLSEDTSYEEARAVARGHRKI